jgi:hypothetical protein
MKSFKTFLNEGGRLYRVDDRLLIPKAQTYAFSPDNTGSGNVEFNRGWKPPSSWERKTGLFTGHYHHVLTYAVPRETRWIVTGKKTKNENPTVHFDIEDKEAIESHRPTLSQYNVRQGFVPTAGGEFFAQGEKAPTPISQTTIDNPLEHIGKHFNVKFVKDLSDFRNRLNFKGIHHTFEGNFEHD